jgi:aspartate/methionine/tyrosine aminotransferase
MPRYPGFATRADTINGSPFGALSLNAARQRRDRRFYPFHLGDSHLLPALSARRLDLDQERLHRYCPVSGLDSYREAVADWVGGQLRIDCSRDNVFAAPGCTGALSIVATTLFDPGDEVLVLTPSWPLIFGILQSQAVAPVDVPIGPDGWPEPDPELLRRRLQAAVTSRTTAIYLSDPNNPAGYVTPSSHLEVIWEVAAAHQLWLVIDIVYKDLVFDGSQWQLPELTAAAVNQPRLVLTGSFSKSHLLAGHRAGYVVVPADLGSTVAKVITHSTYHASTSAQEMALAALAAGNGEIGRVRQSYSDGLEAACAALTARYHRPQAGAFILVDLRDLAGDDEAAMQLMASALDAGVALAPGAAFGTDFGRFARLCYTATPNDAVTEGVQILNGALNSWTSG